MQIAGKFLMLFKISYIYKVYTRVCVYVHSIRCLYTYKSEKRQITAFRGSYFDFIGAGNINYHPKKKSRLKRLKMVCLGFMLG